MQSATSGTTEMEGKHDNHSQRQNFDNSASNTSSNASRIRIPRTALDRDARVVTGEICKNCNEVHRVRCPAKDKQCDYCREMGHFSYLCPTHGGSQFTDSKNGQGDRSKRRGSGRNSGCDRPDHNSRDCPSSKRREEPAPGEIQETSLQDPNREGGRNLTEPSLSSHRRDNQRGNQETSSHRDYHASSGRRRKSGRADQKCFACGKLGHIRAECPVPPARKSSGSVRDNFGRGGRHLSREYDEEQDNDLGQTSVYASGEKGRDSQHGNTREEQPETGNIRRTDQTGNKSRREGMEGDASPHPEPSAFRSMEKGSGHSRRGDYDRTSDCVGTGSPDHPSGQKDDYLHAKFEKAASPNEEKRERNGLQELDWKRDEHSTGKVQEEHRRTRETLTYSKAASFGSQKDSSQRGGEEGNWYKKKQDIGGLESSRGKSSKKQRGRSRTDVDGEKKTNIETSASTEDAEPPSSQGTQQDSLPWRNSDRTASHQHGHSKEPSPDRQATKEEDEENPLMHLPGELCAEPDRDEGRNRRLQGGGRKGGRVDMRQERQQFSGRRHWLKEGHGDFQYTPFSRGGASEKDKQDGSRDEMSHRLPRNYFDEGELMELFFRRESPYSQHHPCQFQLDGQTFNCTEQYMMYMKAVMAGDKETGEKIQQSTDAAEQKRLGREVRGLDMVKWGLECEAVVFRANWAKFSQNPELGRKLLATGKKILVEANPTDSQWGIGLGLDDPRARCRKTWRGANRLGYILMDVRLRLPYSQLLDAHFSVPQDLQHQHPCSEQQDLQQQQQQQRQQQRQQQPQEFQNYWPGWYGSQPYQNEGDYCYYPQQYDYQGQRYTMQDGTPFPQDLYQYPFYPHQSPPQPPQQYSRSRHQSGNESLGQGKGLLPPPPPLQQYQQQQKQQPQQQPVQSQRRQQPSQYEQQPWNSPGGKIAMKMPNDAPSRRADSPQPWMQHSKGQQTGPPSQQQPLYQGSTDTFKRSVSEPKTTGSAALPSEAMQQQPKQQQKQQHGEQQEQQQHKQQQSRQEEELQLEHGKQDQERMHQPSSPTGSGEPEDAAADSSQPGQDDLWRSDNPQAEVEQSPDADQKRNEDESAPRGSVHQLVWVDSESGNTTPGEQVPDQSQTWDASVNGSSRQSHENTSLNTSQNACQESQRSCGKSEETAEKPGQPKTPVQNRDQPTGVDQMGEHRESPIKKTKEDAVSGDPSNNSLPNTQGDESSSNSVAMEEKPGGDKEASTEVAIPSTNTQSGDSAIWKGIEPNSDVHAAVGNSDQDSSVKNAPNYLITTAPKDGSHMELPATGNLEEETVCCTEQGTAPETLWTDTSSPGDKSTSTLATTLGKPDPAGKGTTEGTACQDVAASASVTITGEEADGSKDSVQGESANSKEASMEDRADDGMKHLGTEATSSNICGPAQTAGQRKHKTMKE